jgi:VWFA-related protein
MCIREAGSNPGPSAERTAVFRFRSTAVALVFASGVLAGQQPPAALAPPGQVPDPQMPPITFRSEVNYVEVDATIRDAQGNFVRDLKPGDIQVLEDGVPQTVTAFSLVDIPVELSERALFLPQDIDPDVRSNADAPGGRLYVLLLDDIHTDPTRSVRVRHAAEQFIGRNLGANDLAAVVFTSGRADAAQDFTNSRRLLTQAVDKFMGRKLRSATLNKIDSYNMTRGSSMGAAITDVDQPERLYNARAMLSTVKNLSDWLAGVRGRRKAVVLISEGIDFNIWDTMAPAGAVVDTTAMQSRGDGTLLISDTQDTINAATRANVNIYALDPRGLYSGGDEIMEMTGTPPEAETLGLGTSALRDELRVAQDSLRVLAEETGGFASLTSNDFSTAFRRIVDENSSYYVLGYYSTNEKRDGRFRKIDVRVARPGVRVNARRGYAAPRGKPAEDKYAGAGAGASRELRDAISSPLQVSGLKLAVFAAPMKGPGQKAAIAIVAQFSGRDLTFTEKDGKFTNVLELAYSAVDKDGKVAAGNRNSIDMSLKADTHARVEQSGFRVQTRLELAPGKYQLRVAARDRGAKVGSVHYDLVVPDFLKDPLSISGLILSSAAAGAVPTAGAIPELGGVLRTPPTTARTFSASDEISVLAEIYDNQGAQAHSVDVTATLKAEGRVQVFANSETRSSKELGGARGGYGYSTRIPLKDLAPGLYVLGISAKSTLGGTPAVLREVQVRIVR